jgi:arsenate reductase
MKRIIFACVHNAGRSQIGIDLTGARPRRLTAALARDARMLITMGCGDECPVLPGAERNDWPLPDPKGRTTEEVRKIRDDVRLRVEAFVQSKQWTR